jgi:hypothetical protein
MRLIVQDVSGARRYHKTSMHLYATRAVANVQMELAKCIICVACSYFPQVSANCHGCLQLAKSWKMCSARGMNHLAGAARASTYVATFCNSPPFSDSFTRYHIHPELLVPDSVEWSPAHKETCWHGSQAGRDFPLTPGWSTCPSAVCLRCWLQLSCGCLQ